MHILYIYVGGGCGCVGGWVTSKLYSLKSKEVIKHKIQGVVYFSGEAKNGEVLINRCK